MAYRIVLLVLLNVLLVQCENNELCPCDTEPKDEAALWNFLKKLSVEVPEDEREMFSAAPGQLSPPVDCECESKRKKRGVVDVPEAAEVYEEGSRRDKRYIHFKRNGCPLRYVRLGFMCVAEDDIVEY